MKISNKMKGGMDIQWYCNIVEFSTLCFSFHLIFISDEFIGINQNLKECSRCQCKKEIFERA